MQFQIIDNVGLQITAETTAEVKEVIGHYKLDVMLYIESLSTGHVVHIHRAGKRDNAAWFKVSSFVPAEWIKPYMDKLQHITGYSGPIPSVENAPRYPDSARCVNLCYTHLVSDARIGPDGMVFDGYMHCGDWNGKTADARAPALFAEYVRAGLGATKLEPEHIRLGNGLLKENPNYLHRYAPHAACTSASVLQCLLTWWLDTHATDGQKDVMSKALANHKTVCKTDTLGSWLIREYQGLRTSWESDGLVTFEHFKGI